MLLYSFAKRRGLAPRSVGHWPEEDTVPIRTALIAITLVLLSATVVRAADRVIDCDGHEPRVRQRLRRVVMPQIAMPPRFSPGLRRRGDEPAAPHRIQPRSTHQGGGARRSPTAASLYARRFATGDRAHPALGLGTERG